MHKIEIETKIKDLRKHLITTAKNRSFFNQLTMTVPMISYDNINVQLDAIENNAHSLTTTLDKLLSLHKQSKKKLAQAKIDKQNDLDQLEKVSAEKRSITSERDQLNLKLKLIAALHTTYSTNKGMEAFSCRFQEDFVNFANHEVSLANDAEMLLEMQSIEKELQLMSAYPELHTRSIIAVGGGFSAGKSQFISGFLSSEYRLPIGLQPTTAIPTYVLSASTPHFVACTTNGGVVDISKIDPDFNNKLSHKFIESFGFNIKNIMPQMILGSPLKYENLCFVDTPGYNPAATGHGYTSEDINSAQSFLSGAECILWLIGLDSSGTISTSDLNFLETIDLQSKKFFVVLNKADLKPIGDLEDILDNIVDILDDYDIQTVGISAFSSTQQKEYLFKGQSLFEFLSEANEPTNTDKNILERLLHVYKSYRYDIVRNKLNKVQANKDINTLMLDLIEQNSDDVADLVRDKLQLIIQNSNHKHQEISLELLSKAFLKLIKAVEQIFSKNYKINFHTINNEVDANAKKSLPKNVKTEINEDEAPKRQPKKSKQNKSN